MVKTNSFEILTISDDAYIVVPGRSIISSNVPSMLKNLKLQVGGLSINALTVDMVNVEEIDDYAMLVINYLKRHTFDMGGRFQMINASNDVKEILSFLSPPPVETTFQPMRKKESLISSFGQQVIDKIKGSEDLVVFTGETILSIAGVLRNPLSIRWNDVVSYIRLTGIDAIPIVSLISFLLGLIMAFMSSVQLKQFGANVYVASLVGLSMVRELGPIMTCIIIAGRSGSAYAAEIGSMKVSEEVDALATMGFDLNRYLVTPKIIALVVAAPILTILSDIFANAGGLLVGVSMLDLTVEAYTQQFLETVTLFDLYIGLFKSSLFALLIAWIGCYQGMRVEGGADAVGRASTAAVVNGIFLIVLADSLIAVLMRYWS